MVKACCVAGCFSNRIPGKYVPIFKFPSFPRFRREWLSRIGKDDSYQITQYSAVCIKHFKPDFVVMDDEFNCKGGITVKMPRQQLRLTEEAYPTIFPWHSEFNKISAKWDKIIESRHYLSAHISAQSSNEVKVLDENVEASNLEFGEHFMMATKPVDDDHIDHLYTTVVLTKSNKRSGTSSESEDLPKKRSKTQKNEKNSGQINNFEELKASLIHKDIFDPFFTECHEDYLLISKILDRSFNSVPYYSTLKISKTFNVKVFINAVEVPPDTLRPLLGNSLKCDTWAKVKNLCKILMTKHVTMSVRNI